MEKGSSTSYPAFEAWIFLSFPLLEFDDVLSNPLELCMYVVIVKCRLGPFLTFLASGVLCMYFVLYTYFSYTSFQTCTIFLFGVVSTQPNSIDIIECRRRWSGACWA